MVSDELRETLENLKEDLKGVIRKNIYLNMSDVVRCKSTQAVQEVLNSEFLGVGVTCSGDRNGITFCVAPLEPGGKCIRIQAEVILKWKL